MSFTPPNVCMALGIEEPCVCGGTGFREFLEVILSHYFKIILNKEGYIESVFKHVIKTRK